MATIKYDITGQRFGKLVAREYLGKSYWLFDCDCGGTHKTTSSNVRHGQVKSCGCEYRRTVGQDITGKKFNRLTAIKRIDSRRWLFHCDCGEEKVMDCANIIYGITKSCGCANYENLVGQRFGRLVVVRLDKSSLGTKSGIKWHCKCDCGGEITTFAHSLKTGSTKSCGCLNREKLQDITGVRFGRLVAIKYVGRKNREAKWLCKCDCGNEVVRGLGTLKSDRVHSCGCYLKEGNMYRKHSGCYTLTYGSWSSLKARCLNPNSEAYSYYGGRGIKLCDRWQGEHGFENFLADMGERPGKGYSLDRIDVNGNYEPSNCRWATAKEQANNKRNNVIIEHNGETHTFPEWCEIFGVENVSRARKRYGRGLPFETVFAN